MKDQSGGLFGPDDLAPQLSPHRLARLVSRAMVIQERRVAIASQEHAKLALIIAAPLQSIVGLDEVGRGPLAGPVTAAAVLLDPTRSIQGLADSKKLSEAKRDALAPLIREQALGWGLGWVWPAEIETLNIHHASLEAMRRAFTAMCGLSEGSECKILCAHDRHRVRLVVADGKHRPDLGGLPWEGEVMTIIKGDALVAAISAASIIAKVARDAWMKNYAKTDGRYGFEQHMGYPTPQHWAALEKQGPCPIHRLSWVAKRGIKPLDTVTDPADKY